jgi:hypothetical protein
VLSFASAAGFLPAQTTWIVDANNGPGTSFTDIPPAIAAATDGDTVLVRSGTYTGFSTGKALKVIGEGSVGRPPTVLPPVIITGLAQGKTFTAANLYVDMSSAPYFPLYQVELVENRGRIHLQNVDVNGWGIFSGIRWVVLIGYRISNCAAAR